MLVDHAWCTCPSFSAVFVQQLIARCGHIVATSLCFQITEVERFSSLHRYSEGLLGPQSVAVIQNSTPAKWMPINH